MKITKGRKFEIHIIWISAVFLCLFSFLSSDSRQFNQDSVLIPRQSTTGPRPPYGVDHKGRILTKQQLQAATYIAGVPAYLWQHGCGPTAVAMVVGYYDSHGFPNLVPGDASDQGDNVNVEIASIENYNDYCLPLDSSPNLLKDKSEPPIGDEHQDNCLADFMKTSQSYRGNYYGWSWNSDVKPGFENYVDSGKGYIAIAMSTEFKNFSWDLLKYEIDANRPLVFLVDTDGNSLTDHFVTVVGYHSAEGVDYYGCYHTWDRRLHWYPYRAMATGWTWGIYSVHTFFLTSSIQPPKNVGLQRIQNDFIFFKEHINRLSWEANENNKGLSLMYRILRKPKGASDDAFQTLLVLTEKTFIYEDRGLKKQDFYSYRILAFDTKGRESKAVDISN